MMLYPAMNKLTGYIPNRYMLVDVVARRARQIADEAEETGEHLTEKPVTLAIQEVADGKLAAFEAKEAQTQRMAQISSVAKKYGIPDFMLKDRTIPENTDLDTYMKDVKQEMTNAGFQFNKAPETAEQKLEKEASEFAKMIENDTKQIVEQQNK